jgi:hypothetical protein
MWHAHVAHADAWEAPLQLINDTLEHSNIATTGRLPLLKASDAFSLHLELGVSSAT